LNFYVSQNYPLDCSTSAHALLWCVLC